MNQMKEVFLNYLPTEIEIPVCKTMVIINNSCLVLAVFLLNPKIINHRWHILSQDKNISKHN